MRAGIAGHIRNLALGKNISCHESQKVQCGWCISNDHLKTNYTILYDSLGIEQRNNISNATT